MWSESANGDIYQVVCLILQAAEAHNITVGGGSKYNVPSGDFTTNLPNVPATSQNLTSYALAAIAGADNFNDDNVIARDVFDIIVDVTREVTPTCEFPIVRPYLRTPPTHPQIKSEPCGLLGMCKRRSSLGAHSDDSLISYSSYGWPVRSVERLPPFNSKQLKHPVLVIGNTVRTPPPRTKPSRGLTASIPRLTRSRRSRVHSTPLPCSVTVLSWSSSSVSATHHSLRSRLALWVSWPITLKTPRLVLVLTECWLRIPTDRFDPFFYSFQRGTAFSAQSTTPISSPT